MAKTDFEAWSKAWKDLRGAPAEFNEVLKQWKQPVPSEALGRPLLSTNGMRKNAAVYRGEQTIEAMLLGPKGTVREHEVEGSLVQGLRLRALYNNQALARLGRGDDGQIIADAFGVLEVNEEQHPLAIEVKMENGANCWHAVVQNLQQIRMLRANVRQVAECGAVGAWGMVLAPQAYWSRRGKSHKNEAEKLLTELKKATRARVLLAAFEEKSETIRLIGGHLCKTN